MNFRKPKALILHAAGTNRDEDAALALGLAGAEPEIVHVNALRARQRRWEDYGLLVIPGGFSYADALGAGRLFALDLASYFADEAAAFVASGKPVIGICNGFQVLVRSGLLPGGGRKASLARNGGGRFECRWVRLAAPPSVSVWTRGLREKGLSIACPVAHGEGRFYVEGKGELAALEAKGQVALVYAGPSGAPAVGSYPDNPNGSLADIAGICNEAGNVLGLMPHPENNVLLRPALWKRGAESRRGWGPSRDDSAAEACLELWKAGVSYAAQC